MPASSTATQLTVIGASSRSSANDHDQIWNRDDRVHRRDQPAIHAHLRQLVQIPDSASNTTLATAAYINDSTGSGNHGVAGRRNHSARIFAVSIPLEPGKTVSSVTLPRVATLPGVYPMHVFALALGGSSS